MGNKEKRVIRIIMEYDNGEKIFIEGDDAKKWNEALNDAIFVDRLHGGNIQNILKSILWEKLE